MGKLSNKTLFSIVSALLCALGFSSCARKQIIETDSTINNSKIVVSPGDGDKIAPRPIDKPVYGPPAAYFKEKAKYIEPGNS